MEGVMEEVVVMGVVGVATVDRGGDQTERGGLMNEGGERMRNMELENVNDGS